MTGYPKKRKRDIKDVFGSRGKESKKICERERGAGGGASRRQAQWRGGGGEINNGIYEDPTMKPASAV
jgi:hypothetical protein